MRKSISRYGLAALALVSLLYLGQVVIMRAMYGERSWRDDDRLRSARTHRAFLEYALASRRDSIEKFAANARELVPGVRVAVDPALPSRLSDPIIASLSLMWKQVGNRSGGSPVIIALFLDTAASINGLARPARAGQSPAVAHVIPSAEGAPCIVTLSFLRVPSAEQPPDPHALRSVADASGLCAFFYAFGVPGTGVRNWLSLTGHAAAGDAGWWIAEKKGTRGYADMRRDRGFEMNLRSNRTHRIELLACSAGDTESCGRLVTTPRPRSEWIWQGMGTDDQPGLLVARYRDEYLGFHGSRRWLSDLVRAFGAPRFAKFWKSEKAMPGAFAEAFGMPVSENMKTRIALDYGTIARGAATPWRTALATILASAVLLAAAITNARGWELS